MNWNNFCHYLTDWFFFRITKDHRESLSKNAKTLFIRCRDSVKDVQNKFIKSVKNKEKEGLSKDTSFEIAESVISNYSIFTTAKYHILMCVLIHLSKNGTNFNYILHLELTFRWFHKCLFSSLWYLFFLIPRRLLRKGLIITLRASAVGFQNSYLFFRKECI